MIDKKINFVLVHGSKGKTMLKKDGTKQVFVRAYRNGIIKYISTGVCVEPKQWNDKDKKVKSHNVATELNQRLREVLTQLENYEAEQYKKFAKCSMLTLLDAFKPEMKTQFLAFMKSKIESQPYTKSTKKNHQTTYLKLVKFLGKDIDFENVKYKVLKEFEESLRAEQLAINTIHKHFKNIRTHINEAIRYEYLDVNKNPFLKFKVATEKTYKTPLNERELEALEQWTATPDQIHLNNYKDFFLISCYSGLRFGDVAQLCASNFVNTPDGLVMTIKAQKTGKPYIVNIRYLFRKAGQDKSKFESIIQRHLDNVGDIQHIPFLKVTNQYFNRCLREIFEQIPNIRPEVTENISSHYGRHTFTSIMANHVPAPVLQKLLQHSSLNQTQTYINHSQDDQDKTLKAVFIG